MKTIQIFALAGTFLLAIFLGGCSKDEADTPFYSAANGTSKELTELEKAGLLSLLETEKFHRDVYSVIAERLQSPFFEELSAEDAILMDLLSIKVDKYGLVNPIVGVEAGSYSDAVIQNSYSEFIETNTSDLLTLVAYAEDMERSMIDQIETQQSLLSGNSDIVAAYDQMLKKSIAQLRLLADEMEGLRHIYAPQATHQED
jgi:hypothetical protein